MINILLMIQNQAIGRLALLMLMIVSAMGYFIFLKKQNIPSPFIPGIIVSSVICVCYIGGLLNTLPLVTLLVFVSGIALFIININQISSVLRNICDRRFIMFFVLSSIYFFFVLRKSVINGYDDFSHWATLSKSMLHNDRLPRFSEPYIMFSSYPPGTALFIYYFCRVVGIREGYYLFAQFILKLSFLSSLIEINEEKPKTSTNLLAFVFILLLSAYNVTSHTLSVDTVLSSCGAFCFLAAYHFINEKNNTDLALRIIAVSGTACVLIKNSGLFFYLSAVICALFSIHYSDKLRLRKHNVLLFSVPLVSLTLWKKHVALVFESGLNAKHTMTVSHYSKMLSEKSMDEVFQEASIIIKCILNPSSNHLFPVVIGCILLFCIKQGMQLKKERAFFFMIIGTIAIYEIALVVTYIVSMPHKEVVAQNGADYIRYNGTIVAFVAAILFYMVEKMINEKNMSRKTFATVTISIICIAASLSLKMNISDFDPRVDCYLFYRNRVGVLREIKQSYKKGEEKTIVRVNSELNRANYFKYALKYITLSEDSIISTEENDTLFMKEWKESDASYCIDTIDHKVMEK